MTTARRAQHRLEPAAASDLLHWFVRNGFTTHLPGGPELPHVLVLSRVSGSFVDVAHVRGADRTEVARVPLDEHADIWCPRAVCWHYYGSLVDALGALQRMHARVGDLCLRRTYAPPRDGTPRPLTVTESERCTVTVRPPRSRPTTDRPPP